MQQISEKATNVCRLIARGYSVQKACAETHFGTDSFYDEMRVSEALAKEYERARACRSDVRFEEFERITRFAESGAVDAQTARFLLEAVKWQTAIEKPRTYGIKNTIEHTGNITLSSLVESSLAVTDQSKEIIDLEPLPVDKGKEFI